MIKKEFIVLMAFLMSLTALAIDAMLPALGSIQQSLNIQNPNNLQFIISSVFFGMAIGLMFYGPLSDAIGRKKPLYIGLTIFIFGSLVSALSQNLEVMLVGRFLQGFGTASCRVVSMAMIRDQFSGPEMGRIMSLIMVVFIIVPAIAPAIGQGIISVSDWHSIFYLFFILGAVAILILYFNQEETLVPEKRILFTFKNFLSGVKETFNNIQTRNYTIASGLTSGAFVGYLVTSQQILQIQFKLGTDFSLYFGILALFIGASSFLNSKLVLKYGLEKLSFLALIALSLISTSYLLIYFIFEIDKSLVLFMCFLCCSFLFIGVLFGNLSTLAIEPLGHIAGVANSVISAAQTLISVVIGGVVGYLYSGTVLPLVISYLLMSLLALIVIRSTKLRSV